MPLGWYLAQGLYPLNPSSSDDEEGPCELPDGRIVCGPHGLVTCGKCCTDYSFMDESDPPSEVDEDDEEDVPIPEMRRGTGQVFPTKFTPPTSSITPTNLFRGQSTRQKLSRYIHREDPKAFLVFTDGACLNNGQPDPRAGWAFIYGPGGAGRPLYGSNRLESKGPFGDHGLQTSNRAELRAAIAALRFLHWPDEGFNTMTIATDSEYVVDGSTSWVRQWVKNNWKTSAGKDVKNRDLWELLLGECERYKEHGLSIQFWRIPREWNEPADAAAKTAASKNDVPDQWTDYDVRAMFSRHFA